MLEPCIILFPLILEANSNSTVHADLQAIAEALANLCDGRPLSGLGHKHIDRIRVRLGLAAAASEAPWKNLQQQSSNVRKATFTVAQDIPGDLYADGPRHDNDSASIEDVQIRPTMQEIQSDRHEYLPRQNPLGWHLRGIAGLSTDTLALSVKTPFVISATRPSLSLIACRTQQCWMGNSIEAHAHTVTAMFD